MFCHFEKSDFEVLPPCIVFNYASTWFWNCVLWE